MTHIVVFLIGYIVGAVCCLYWLHDQREEIFAALMEAIEEEQKGK